MSRDCSQQKFTEIRREEESVSVDIELYLQRETLFRAMIEKSSDGIVLINREGTVLYHSPAVERILGWTPEERQGKQIMDLLHPDDQKSAFGHFSQIVQQPGSAATSEVRMRHKNGTWRWVEGLITNLLEEPSVGAIVGNYRDVTARKETEEYTQKITAAIEQADDLIFITDVDGTIRYVNAAFERVTGYRREEVIGNNPRFLKSGKHPQSFYESVWQTLLSGRPFRARFLNRKKTGEIYADDRTIAPVRNASGHIVAFVSTGRDVTEQLALREKLEQRSKILRSFFEFSVSPMVLLDRQFNYIDVNEAYARACGREREDFRGQNHFDLYASDAKADFERVVETKQPARFSRRPFVFPDHPEWGVTYWDWTLTPVLDNNGNVEILIFSLVDVTQQVQVEQKLREREEYLGELMDAVGVGIFGVSMPDRIISYVNRGAAECFGYSAEEIIGKTTRMFYPEDSLYEEFGRRLRQALEHGSPYVRAELRLLRKNGEQFWADVHTTFLSTGDALRQVISVVRNIDTQKQIDHDLRRSREQLRSLYRNLQRRREEERARIAREIHDSIGQSLTVLKLDIALLTDDLNTVLDSRRFDAFVKKLESMNALIDSASGILRDISAELRPPILDSLGLSEAIEWHLSDFGKKSGIQFDYKKPTESIPLDREQATALFRILQECLVNVVRHAHAHRVFVSLRCDRDHVILEVTDDGIGIRESDPLGAHSLGILGMKERAAAFGGVVEISGKPENGTCVRARLPITNSQQSSDHSPES